MSKIIKIEFLDKKSTFRLLWQRPASRVGKTAVQLWQNLTLVILLQSPYVGRTYSTN